MEPVTLQQILAARDHRVQRQRQLLEQYHVPLICFTMNIAGPVKHSPLIEAGFRLGLRRLEQQLIRLHCPVRHREIICESTGCEALFAVDAPAEVLKTMTVDLEEADRLGRLLDLDVLDRQGHKLERQRERGCLICGAAGRGCARSRAHTVEALQEATTAILTAALRDHRRKLAAELACRALLFEACTTPKPGLVDRRNSGSHEDMDLFTFLASSAALMPYLQTCVSIGQETAQLPPTETFRRLRRSGRLAEGEMFRATGGVNTHKGAIFLMGVLCGALGRLESRYWNDSNVILRECAAMTAGITGEELGRHVCTTAGERFYAAAGIGGVRREVENGLPTVGETGLPVLRQTLAEGASLEEAGCKALLAMMAVSEDTALLHRCGVEGWRQVKSRAASLLETGVTVQALEQLDAEMIEKHWSPGGSADLLAVCYFLYFLSEQKT